MRHAGPGLGLLLCAFATNASAVDPLAIQSPAQNGTTRAFYAEASAFLGNDVAPIVQVRKDWADGYSPRTGRNLALISARAETGVQWRGFRFGLVSRQEWFAEAAKDTADIVRAEKLNADYDTGRRYTADYRLRGFTANGFRLGKAFLQNLSAGWTANWGVAASVLRGSKMRREDISGNAIGTGGQSYDATADWRRDYSNMDTTSFAPAFRDGHPDGHGYAGDLGLRLERDDGLRFEYAVNDLVGRMRWTGIPEMTLSGTNVFAGTLPGGRMIRVDFNERLPRKQTFLASVPLQSARVELSDSTAHGYHFPRLGLRPQWGPEWEALLDYDFRFKSVGVALSYQGFFVNIQSDALNFNKAKAFGLSFGLHHGF